MNIKEYQEEALSRLNPLIANNQKESINYALLGISEETGEIAGEIRKSFYKGNYHEREFCKEKLSEELGDLIWNIALVCKNKEIEIESLQSNKQKQLMRSNKKQYNEEKIKKMALNLEKIAGEVVEESENENVQMLAYALKKLYNQIEDIAYEIGVTMEMIFQQNISKINSRYDKGGVVKNDER